MGAGNRLAELQAPQRYTLRAVIGVSDFIAQLLQRSAIIAQCSPVGQLNCCIGRELELFVALTFTYVNHIQYIHYITVQEHVS